MALPSSGQITLNEIHVEAGGTSGTQASINDTDIRALIGKTANTQMAFSEWYGASASAQFVGSYGYVNASSVSGTLPISGNISGLANGDLVVVVAGGGNGNDITSSDMTRISLSWSSGPGVGFFYFIWAGSNPTVSGQNWPGVFSINAFRNVTTLDNATTAYGASGSVNPPSCAQVSGTKLIVPCAVLDDDVVTMTAPSGYSQGATAKQSYFGFAASVSAGYLITNSSSTVDPGVFSGGNDEWYSATLRFR